jgi:hypothetical protein
MVQQRAGKVPSQRQMLEATFPSTTGIPRDYTLGDVERIVALLRFRQLAGFASIRAWKEPVLAKVPTMHRPGWVIVSEGQVGFWPRVVDWDWEYFVAKGVLALKVHDDCHCL